ncbi:MAG: xanthine phosphoribosyltransferase [Alloprevotella sp.]|nr:xanthine phosphoribosyltransferase [Bacteroidales bacterium]MDD7563443.1 xanthine phosphoribosyltransferase [Prevotellamassilia sp.]MDY2779180.1 xanthine phosphoribosyltransferase [Alloprevotella sp.]MDY4059184.1 xanthine phosphoribosyltransferase [Alloprevotella sp.]MDY4568350.1 xanthine phosphoribosyltransferase [Alloprevotella sp.]
MNFLEAKIAAEGYVGQGNILKVDHFLNHQIDVKLIFQIAEEFKRRFDGRRVDKVLTIEASGIAIATLLGHLYGVPVVFAKKGATANCTDDKYMAEAYSFTHKRMNRVFVSKPYLNAGEHVLIVDDFLADGQAASALISLVEQAGGTVSGIGIAIEKGQQQGGQLLRQRGYHLESLAIVRSMDHATQTITFAPQPASH